MPHSLTVQREGSQLLQLRQYCRGAHLGSGGHKDGDFGYDPQSSLRSNKQLFQVISCSKPHPQVIKAD